jgi:predicted metal-dependent hydrolase
MGVEYSSIKMSDAQRRWGSCSAKNALNFAWRLVMCPLSVIDYVVVHELSHITYKNHSTKFWSRVATVMPRYREALEWLRLNRKLMEVI